MSKIKITFIIVNLIALIGYFNWSILAKEKIVDQGKLVLLALAPVDPRSLMQGDYMRLNYVINDLPSAFKVEKRGFCILKKNKEGFEECVRFQKELQPLRAGEIGIRYFSEGNRYFPRIHVGAESYFFEEGTAKIYETAKFGGLRVDEQGNSVLIGLYDQKLKLIKP